ncbi:oxygenase MpaB family protein [Mycobacteroides salmoniphilum]|uniref:oxygenase MpaB family protein n=1 Tax=Mycobacteroides salmoniphilum TaxID=404941 RepID=UPI001F2BC168|nr:oxygenase MpaB family protein [Mycobacteroides salmoniphilum]
MNSLTSMAPPEPRTRTAAPSAFRWDERSRSWGPFTARRWVRRLTGFDVFPRPEVAAEFARLRTVGDPVAERFVAETIYGELGRERTNELVDRALAGSIEAVPEAPESMRALFAEFENIPEWVDPELIEAGAAVWRRWAYHMGAMANAATMDTYTEGSLAVPLVLAGGYAGQSALHRYLETSRWWIESCRPEAALTPGSRAREISMKVRIMHVSIRKGVQQHVEWDSQRWGLPISQAEMLLTLMGGSVAPGLGLYVLGHITSKREIEACMHFSRYLGHLLGVRCDAIYPTNLADGVRILYMFDTARSYDSGENGRQLIESFVPSFAPAPNAHLGDRLRAAGHLRVQAAHVRLYVRSHIRRQHHIPAPVGGLAYLMARIPLVLMLEAARRVCPPIDRLWQSINIRAWERWHAWALGNEAEQFVAPELRR